MTAQPINNNNSTVLTSAVINSIYELFVHYIEDVDIPLEQIKNDSLYNIPVTEFKEHLADTEFSKYKYSDIREGLANFTKNVKGQVINGTKCSFGRNDNTIVRDGKRIKVISFVEKVVGSYRITKLPEDDT